MARFEVWKTTTIESVCFIEAKNLEEAEDILKNEPQDWESLDGENATYIINEEAVK